MAAPPIAAIVDTAARYGTPLWVLDAERVQQNIARWDVATSSPALDVFYSVKSNPAPPLLRTMLDHGIGLDVASAFDVVAGEAAGFPPERLTFCTKSPSPDDIAAALRCGTIVAGNAAQLTRWIQHGVSTMGLRVNPGIAAGFHPHVQTAPAGRRFGTPIAEAPDTIDAARADGTEIAGLHCHLGSDILDAGLHLDATDRLLSLCSRVGGIEWVSIGGGYGIPFPGDSGSYDLDALLAGVLDQLADRRDPVQVRFEPGAHLSRDAGWLVAAVRSVSMEDGTQAVECDANVNHLPGALLYGTQHPVTAVRQSDAPADPTELMPTLITGDLMQPGDILASAAELPPLQPDDLVAFGLAGAYTAVRASTFNGRPMPAEVWLGPTGPEVVQARLRPDELHARLYG